MKTSFVVGLAFCPNYREVVLVETRHPRLGVTHLNGPMGAVCPGESQVQAMVRIFAEQTGIITATSEWGCFAIFADNAGNETNFFHHVFVGRMPSPMITAGKPVVIAPLETTQSWYPNLRWLIPMALNCARHEDNGEYFTISEYPKLLGVLVGSPSQV